MTAPEIWYEHYSSGVKAKRGWLRICKRQGNSFVTLADVYDLDGRGEERARIMVDALLLEHEEQAHSQQFLDDLLDNDDVPGSRRT